MYYPKPAAAAETAAGTTDATAVEATIAAAAETAAERTLETATETASRAAAAETAAAGTAAAAADTIITAEKEHSTNTVTGQGQTRRHPTESYTIRQSLAFEISAAQKIISLSKRRDASRSRSLGW